MIRDKNGDLIEFDYSMSRILTPLLLAEIEQENIEHWRKLLKAVTRPRRRAKYYKLCPELKVK